MVIFKEKKNKSLKCKNRITLDAQHNLKIKTFKNLKKSLIKIKNRKLQIEEKIIKLSKKKNINLKDHELEEKLNLREELKNIDKKITEIENDSEMNDYLLNTSNLLFHYYNDNLEDSKKKKKKTLIKKQLSVVDFFSKEKKNIKSDNEINKNVNPIKKKKKYTKNDILSKYLNLTDKDYINSTTYFENDIDYCLSCNVEKIYYQSEGIMVCPKCAKIEKILLDSDKPSYKEPPREISYFAYKRINHFNEWLAQFQAKESTDIPKYVYEKIKIELNKESYLKRSELKISKIRDILKKLNLNKYYEHVPHIINRLSGKPAPIIKREVEEKLRMMFKEIQSPWIKHCPNNRSNFLSYSYVLYKCLQLLEMDSYLNYFNLLKSREKLAEQDKIWKKICSELKWEFIKTI